MRGFLFQEKERLKEGERWCGESNEMQERHFAQFSALSPVNSAAAG